MALLAYNLLITIFSQNSWTKLPKFQHGQSSCFSVYQFYHPVFLSRTWVCYHIVHICLFKLTITLCLFRYLHEVCSPSAIHKNIKSANILLDAELNPRLADCGLTVFFEVSTKFTSIVWCNHAWLLGHNSESLTSVFLQQDTNDNLGPGYNAPECTKPSAYTIKSDVYSFGVVMLELLTGRKPYDR